MPLSFDPATHTYRLDGRVLPSVTQVLRGVGLIDFTGIDQDILDRASALGTAVHEACHYDDIGDLDEEGLDDNIRPYLDAWRAFRNGLKFEEIEVPLYSASHLFAGTPDRIALKLIIDIKTSTTIYQVTALQLAGYSILSGYPTARRLAVQLKPDGKFTTHEFKDRRDREVFLSALAVYRWKRRNNGTTGN